MYYLSIKLNPKLYFEKIIDRYLAFLKEKDRVMFLSLIIWDMPQRVLHLMYTVMLTRK